MLHPREGTELAALSNDRLAEACRKYPDRFSGLAAFAARTSRGAVAEIERGMTRLGLNGAVLNSHTQGHYLDEPAFAPILEALEHFDAALYIHPTARRPNGCILTNSAASPAPLAGFFPRGVDAHDGADLFRRLRPAPQAQAGHRPCRRGDAAAALSLRLDAIQCRRGGRACAADRRR
ncbi:MAG: amidohydrolase family protein [Rhizomicrobium sp.]